MTTQHLASEMIQIKSIFSLTRWPVSSYLGLHTYIVMSPLVLALLIVAVVGDESVDSGEHDYYKITDI